MGAYMANPDYKVIHRKPARPACTSQLQHRMELTTTEVYMTLRTNAWTLCGRCFTRPEQDTMYELAQQGRIVDVHA